MMMMNHSTLSRPRFKMQQGIRTLKQKCNAAIIALCPRQGRWCWVHARLRKLCQLCPNP